MQVIVVSLAFIDGKKRVIVVPFPIGKIQVIVVPFALLNWKNTSDRRVLGPSQLEKYK